MAYRRNASVTLGRDGIRRHSVFGARFLAWSDLQATATAGSEILTFFQVTAATRKLYLYPLIDGFSDLQATVEARLAQGIQNNVLK